jgi:hypothetical protein
MGIDPNATPFSDKNAAASKAGTINSMDEMGKRTPAATDGFPVNRKNNTVNLDAVLGPSRFSAKR